LCDLLKELLRKTDDTVHLSGYKKKYAGRIEPIKRRVYNSIIICVAQYILNV